MKKFIKKAKTKWLVHSSFWGIYLFFGIYSFILTYAYGNKDYLLESVITTLIYVCCHALSAYVSAQILTPLLLFKKKYFFYVTGVLATIISSGFLLWFLTYWYLINFPDIFATEFGKNDVIESFFLSTLLITALFVAFKIGAHWFYNERIKEKLQKEKIEAELKFLKSQINPHFLFNGINSIYHLIDINRDKAKNTLLKLSDLLRYQLYECKDDFVPIGRELFFINNYIDIELIRKGEDIRVTKDIIIEDETRQIAPLILIPFIENAFKHVSAYNEGEKNQIAINLNSDAESLKLNISNTKDKNIQKHINNVGGIGLENVKKRLALIYDQKFYLQINNSDNNFSVNLEIIYA